MERPRFGLLLVLGLSAISGCSPSTRDGAPERTDNGGWLRPPVVTGIARTGTGLTLSGLAEPGGRVVLRADAGAGFATSADARGRFEVRMPVPTAHVWLRPELQSGRRPSVAPERVLVMAAGPSVVLTPGGATRRLDGSPTLSSIDSDGRSLRLAGVAENGGREVSIVAGGVVLDARTSEDGSWSVVLPAEGIRRVEVDGVAYDWPGEGAANPQPMVQRASGGWRIDWTTAGGARQSSWLPDATAGS